MTARPRPGPVRRLVRYLTPPQLRVYAAFWAIIVLALGGGHGHHRTGFATVDFSVYLVMGQAAPKWFLFVMGLAHRRDGSAAVRGLRDHAPARVHGGGHRPGRGEPACSRSCVLACSGSRRPCIHSTGLSAGLTGPLPVTSVTGAGWLVLTGTVGTSCGPPRGWIVGVGYYRFGPWLGTAFLVPAASIPLVIGELAVRAGDPRTGSLGLGGLGDAADAAPARSWSAVAVLAVLAAYLVVRDLTIRKVSG